MIPRKELLKRLGEIMSAFVYDMEAKALCDSLMADIKDEPEPEVLWEGLADPAELADKSRSYIELGALWVDSDGHLTRRVAIIGVKP